MGEGSWGKKKIGFYLKTPTALSHAMLVKPGCGADRVCGRAGMKPFLLSRAHSTLPGLFSAPPRSPHAPRSLWWEMGEGPFSKHPLRGWVLQRNRTDRSIPTLTIQDWPPRTVEREEVQDLQAAGRRPRRAGGVSFSPSPSPRAGGDQCLGLDSGAGRDFLLTQPSVLCRPLAVGGGPRPWGAYDSNAHLGQKRTPQTHPGKCLAQ